MNWNRQAWLALTLLILLAGCTPMTQSAATPVATTASEATASEEEFTMRVLTTGLEQPWELIYGPDEWLWLTERAGKRVIRVNPADGTITEALTVDDAYQQTIHDGVLGMALHPDLLQDTGNNFVYLAYVYNVGSANAVARRAKIVRYSYDAASQTLGDPLDLLSDLPASGDHNSGRLVFGPDEKLYYTIGDQGRNQFASVCLPILAQELPTESEIATADWTHYQGKILRLNLDGSIPDDNPTINGVQSHVYSYGHRNAQGLVFSPSGTLYASEHGPKTDDEVNQIEAGKNYGWPHVSGFQDDRAYVYGNWSAAPDCGDLEFSDFAIPASVPQTAESAWSDPNFVEPLFTFGSVDDEHDFQPAECEPNFWMCWPTVAPSGLEFYAFADGIAGWGDSLLVPAIKTGTIYRLAVNATDASISGDALPLFRTVNRYRDVAVSPDGRTFYVITDSAGVTQDRAGLPTNELENPGAILVFEF